MSKYALLFAALFFAFGSPASMVLAVDYFVSGTGNDGNTGLSSAQAFRTITQAMTAAGNGDRVIVETGAYDGGAGEAFPIVVSDGVSIEGPGNGTAVVDSTGTPGPSFFVGSLVNPTSISGLSISAHTTSGTCINASGHPASLSVIDNVLTGENGFANIAATTIAPGGSPTIVFESNVVTAGDLGFLWAFADVAGTHNLTVRNNSMIGGSFGIVLYGVTAGTGQMLLNAAISSNFCSSGSSAGIGVFLFDSSGTTAAVINADIVNNTANSCDAGVEVQCLLGGASNSANLTINARSNLVTNCSSVGIFIQGQAGSGAALFVGGVIECNTVTGGSSGPGIGVILYGISAIASATGDVRYNECIGNDLGLACMLLAGSGGTANWAARIFGNTLTGANSDGVSLSSSTSLVGVIGLPDFGGGLLGSIGLNTISGNDTAVTGNFDFNLSGVTSGQSVLAESNWWGATTTTAISALVNDVNDSATYGTLDFIAFLVDPLVFTATAGGPGQLVSVTAGAGAAFVQKAGSTAIQVTLNGVPVLNPAVSASGAALSFVVPIGVLPGNRTLLIVNPGGQMGTFIMIVVAGAGGGGGLCFVATAAYGDVNAAEVRLLRRWRDECLASNAFGRALVKGYYAVSPQIAGAISERPAARTAARAALAPVVGAVRLWMEWPAAYAIVGLVLFGSLLRRRKR